MIAKYGKLNSVQRDIVQSCSLRITGLGDTLTDDLRLPTRTACRQ